MLCATNNRAPRAASRRFRVPSVRSRFVGARSCATLRGFTRLGIAVIWWTTASGAAAPTARASDSRSKTSHAAMSAPARARIASPSRERAMAVTACPASSRTGTSARPMTPVAPATNTRMGTPLSARATLLEHGRDSLDLPARARANAFERAEELGMAHAAAEERPPQGLMLLALELLALVRSQHAAGRELQAL